MLLKRGNPIRICKKRRGGSDTVQKSIVRWSLRLKEKLEAKKSEQSLITEQQQRMIYMLQQQLQQQNQQLQLQQQQMQQQLQRMQTMFMES